MLLLRNVSVNVVYELDSNLQYVDEEFGKRSVLAVSFSFIILVQYKLPSNKISVAQHYCQDIVRATQEKGICMAGYAFIYLQNH